jgi:hypothetical protein
MTAKIRMEAISFFTVREEKKKDKSKDGKRRKKRFEKKDCKIILICRKRKIIRNSRLSTKGKLFIFR